jgi:hypothetical protein
MLNYYFSSNSVNKVFSLCIIIMCLCFSILLERKCGIIENIISIVTSLTLVIIHAGFCMIESRRKQHNYCVNYFHFRASRRASHVVNFKLFEYFIFYIRKRLLVAARWKINWYKTNIMIYVTIRTTTFMVFGNTFLNNM